MAFASVEPAVPEGGTVLAERPQSTPVELVTWVTIVWDDPVNLMSYVTHVFVTYFGYSKSKATKLMLQVHNEGRSVVSSGTREAMETDVSAMHGYGLWASLERAQ
ncbi:MAG TPA: ATP-dependent Clp protease adapter ClpS [Micropruina sp.]|jgi:ATP-dependent Clp protease adaptor protein ClpS|nr:ATP-dependent Clp protease adapter ClpS [Micropruina sp.]